MNQQQVTDAIVLGRTDFGEADRIITVLTADQGKLRLMAKGVRKIKSKLAGGIELFSVSTITYIRGRGEIGTLVSARLVTHYGHIIKNIDRTMLGYNLIKQLNKATEDEPEPAYYQLLEEAFDALNDADISVDLIQLWFSAQLLRLAGHSPNLQTESGGARLQADKRYEFSLETGAFTTRPGGKFVADHIKFLRLAFAGNAPQVLQQVQGGGGLLTDITPLMATMYQTYLR
jgi:DNA repair protein RecO (recombination protein O)